MRLDQKKVTVQMRPPPLSFFAPSPVTYTLLPFLSCLPLPPCALTLRSKRTLSHPLSPLCSPALSLSLPAPAQNKFAMKMGKNDHHGPARETQGESDIIPPTPTPPQPSSLAPVGRLCHKSFVYSHFCERPTMLLTA